MKCFSVSILKQFQFESNIKNNRLVFGHNHEVGFDFSPGKTCSFFGTEITIYFLGKIRTPTKHPYSAEGMVINVNTIA